MFLPTMPRFALLSCSCTMQTILRTCAVTKTDRKTHARSRTRQGQWSAWPPEQGQRQRQSRGWQRGRRQSSSWQEFDTTELGRKEAASNARLRQEKPRAVARIRHRDLCFNLGKLPAYLRQKHQNDIIEMLTDAERLSVRTSARDVRSRCVQINDKPRAAVSALLLAA